MPIMFYVLVLALAVWATFEVLHKSFNKTTRTGYWIVFVCSSLAIASILAPMFAFSVRNIFLGIAGWLLCIGLIYATHCRGPSRA